MATPPDIRVKPPSNREDALAVLLRLREAGHVAYFAGGCVRDFLLKLPSADYDVATDAQPPRVRELFSRSQSVGAAFGVVLVQQGASSIEVATFRSDGAYLDGRRPESVRFTSAQEDAQRRDFTVNGLFLDPVENRVIDYVGGEADLRARVLRAIGDPLRRFGEDHLRLLRAVRFAARFDFAIEPATAGAIVSEAAHLKRISPERIADELRLMLTPATRGAAWRLLWQFGLVPEILRHLAVPAPAAPADAQSLFLAVEPGERVPFSLALAAAGICYQRSGNARPGTQWCVAPTQVRRLVQALRQGLRISNQESDAVEMTVGWLHPLLGDAFPTRATLRRFLGAPTVTDSLALLQALQRIGEQRERVGQLQAALEPLRGLPVAPAPLVTGDDLTAMGLSPGPSYRRILEQVYDAQLEDRVADKAAALALAASLAGSTG